MCLLKGRACSPLRAKTQLLEAGVVRVCPGPEHSTLQPPGNKDRGLRRPPVAPGDPSQNLPLTREWHRRRPQLPARPEPFPAPPRAAKDERWEPRRAGGSATDREEARSSGPRRGAAGMGSGDGGEGPMPGSVSSPLAAEMSRDWGPVSDGGSPRGAAGPARAPGQLRAGKRGRAEDEPGRAAAGPEAGRPEAGRVVTAAPAEPRPSRRPRDGGGPGHGRENPEDDEVLLGPPGLLSRPQSPRRRCPAPSAASHGGHLTAPHGAGGTEIAGR